MEVWDEAPPAPPLVQVKDRRIALVTTSGVVPWGNPDRFKTYRNTHWQKYNIAEPGEPEPEMGDGAWRLQRRLYESESSLWSSADALRALESEGAIGPGKLYPAYYVIPGNQGSPAVMRRVGQEIAADLKKDAVEGVLFVAT